MATMPELPTKRVVEEAASGSESLPKKPRADYSESECLEFMEFDDPSAEWERHVQDLKDKCKLREIQLFLMSEGCIDEANNVLSLNDNIALCTLSNSRFCSKGWILRPNPGPYDDYQRLYGGNLLYGFNSDELVGDFADHFFTHDSDLAFLHIFKDLESSIKWDLSNLDAQKMVEEASKIYDISQPYLVSLAIQDTRTLKHFEQENKELIRLYTKLWQEVVRNKRNFREVLIEIKNEDAASFPCFKGIIEDDLSKEELWKQELVIPQHLEVIKRYIDTAFEGCSDDNDPEELIHRYFHQERRGLVPYTYAD